MQARAIRSGLIVASIGIGAVLGPSPRADAIAAAAPEPATATTPAKPQPRPLGVLNASNWQSAKGLIPDEFLQRYKNGEWAHEIYEVPSGTVLGDQDFLAAGKHNAGRYGIGPQGQIIEVSTGKQPSFIYGPPFPNIDPSDPKAGIKCVWNFFYQSYLLGNSRNTMNLDFLGTGGLERRLVVSVYQSFFDGQPEKYRPSSNPQNLLFQQISGVMRPADLQGTVGLSHRFRDPGKRDQQWTYVPALRRVRAVSPANRSDGFLGSDMSQDDGSYFDGKPEDFEWRLIGESEVLFPYDRAALLEGKHVMRVLPSGGIETCDGAQPRFAYQQPGGSGDSLPWQPLGSVYVLIKRRVWVVEGTPKDPYYLFGKLVLRLDKVTWDGTYNSKYDWKGEILNSYFRIYGPHFPIGDGWRGYAWAQSATAQNWRANRATVTYPNPENHCYRSRIDLPGRLFTVQALTRWGK